MASDIGTIECTIENLYTSFDGKPMLTVSAPALETKAIRKIYDVVLSGRTVQNTRLTATFAWYKEKRSLNANAYFHVLVGKIAKAIGESESDVKRQLVCDYGAQAAVIVLPKAVTPESAGVAYARWINDIVSPKGVECSQYGAYKPTHTLDTAEMARLINGTIAEAKQLGIETKTPAEIEKIITLWQAC